MKNFQKKNEFDVLKKRYKNGIILSKKNENLKLDSKIKLINIEGDTIQIKDIIKKNTLIFRYSILNCGDCVDAEFENLKKYSKEYLGDIKIITFYQHKRSLIVDYKKIQKLKLNNVSIYMLPDNKLGIPLDKQNTPFYFILDSELIMSNVFIPFKEEPKLSKYYLKFAYENFLK